MYDAIAIGALNVDYIMTAQRTKALGFQLLNDLKGTFECGIEKHVSEDQIQYVLSRAELNCFDVFLGGSAFNSIYTIAATKARLTLGYIGVAGSTGIDGLDFCTALEKVGVDTRFVLRPSSARSGVCVSFLQEGQRALITNPGANIQVFDHLKNNYYELIEYLGQSQVVHLTPFFDDNTTTILLSLLTEAKRRNPMLRVSVDPGHHWVTNQTSDIYGVLKLTDFLFVNDLEFTLLAERGIGLSEKDLAESIFKICSPNSPLILLKSKRGIKCFDRKQERLVSTCYSNVPIPSDSIIDDTGAGDVFAGGFLTAALSEGMGMSDRIALGLRLVNAKLLSAGSSSFTSFPGIFKDLVREIGHR